MLVSLSSSANSDWLTFEVEAESGSNAPKKQAQSASAKISAS